MKTDQFVEFELAGKTEVLEPEPLRWEVVH
jgi:hypothetical protein